MTDFVATECGIRQLYARFADAVWRQDGDDFAACFATDGERRIPACTCMGVPRLARHVRSYSGDARASIC